MPSSFVAASSPPRRRALRAHLRLHSAVLSAALAAALPVAAAHADPNPARIFGSSTTNLTMRVSHNTGFGTPNFDDGNSDDWTPVTAAGGQGNNAYDRLNGTEWVGMWDEGDLRSSGWTQYTGHFDLPTDATVDSGFGVRVLVDNEVRDISINGHSIGCSFSCDVFQFAGGQEPGLNMLPAADLLPTGNILQIAVLNIGTDGQPSQTDDAGGVDFAVDQVGPRLHAPDVAVDATDSSGAHDVAFPDVAASSADGGHSVSVTCDSVAGANDFPIGGTPVECSATDAGFTTTETFMVTVTDAAPELTLPADITAEATTPTGADVVFAAPSAVDAVDGARPVVCVDDDTGDAVQSGHHFHQGITSLHCSASDSAGNAASGQFWVTVRDTTAAVTTDDVASAYTAAPQPVTLAATDAGSDHVATYYATGVDPVLRQNSPAYSRRPANPGTLYDPAAKPTLADGERIAYATYDAHGNVEATKLSAVAHVDASVPDTTIASAAKGTITTNQATFAFAGSLPTAMTYECKFEGASFGPCTSPETIDSITEGEHTFVVRAISRAGVVDPTPATETFTVKFPSAPIGTTPSPEPPTNAGPTEATTPTTVKPVLAGKRLVFIPGSFGARCTIGGDTPAICAISVLTKSGVELANGTSAPRKGSVAVGLALTDDGIRRLGKSGKPIPVRVVATAFGSAKVTGEISTTFAANRTITVQLKGHTLTIGKAATAELAAAGVALDGADSVRCIGHTDDAGGSAAVDLAITEQAAKAACKLIAEGTSTKNIASRGAGHTSPKGGAANTRRVVVEFSF